MTSEKLEKIAELVRQLKLECYTAGIPMITVIQYDRKDRPVILAESISPALVRCENGSRIFYDIQNILSGNFRTVPNTSREAEYFE